ncbi:hypothetical protein TNCV_53341 [Trichonephila clavipes]|nr:hypothetical protein TNCV_53341 [Trichonephila clavipes]
MPQNVRNCVCVFCEKKFATQQALEAHARAVHDVEDEMTFAFEGNETHQEEPLPNIEEATGKDVADASNCLSTQAYNVLCRVDRSPQDANPIPPGEYNIGASTSTSSDQDEDPIPPGEYNIGASTSTSSPLQWSANRQHFTCEQCGRERGKEERREGRTAYQIQTNHSPPLQSEGRLSVQDTQPPARDTGQPTQEEARKTECTAGIALLGQTLRITFPLPKLMHCPVRGCTAPFTTAKWTWTVNSVKRHLRALHKIGPTQVQYWCAPTADASRRASQRYTRSCNSWSRMRGKPERARGRVSTVRKLFRTRRVS